MGCSTGEQAHNPMSGKTIMEIDNKTFNEIFNNRVKIH
jgi:hypothetical protein